MRIIGGRFRGRKLINYHNETTHPTTDRVKENVFNILNGRIDFADCSVLDLFAGTGQYGLEAHSRGAMNIIFNDSDPNAAAVIMKNCESINFKTQILNLDFLKCLEKYKHQKFNLIFLDPPYASDFGNQAVEFLFKNQMLIKNGFIVFETSKDRTFEIDCFDTVIKKYGRAQVLLLSHK